MVEDFDIPKGQAYCTIVSNIIMTIIVCSGGSYLVLQTMINCHADWNRNSANKQISTSTFYNLSVLANLIMVMFIFMIGVVLTICTLWNIRSESRPKYTFNPFFFIKSVELGGLVYGQFCLIMFAFIVPYENKKDENWDISSFFFVMGMIFTLVKIFDIYVLVSLFKLDELLRKDEKQSKWRQLTTALQIQTISLKCSNECRE